MKKEQNSKREETYKDQANLSFLGVLLEAPNFVMVFISAFVSQSLVIWIDFIDSFSNITREGFIVFLSKKLQKNLKYKYNYGVAKIEAMASLFCDFCMIIGVLCLAACSVIELFTPKQPSDFLFYVIFLKIVNVFFDALLVAKEYKIYNANKTSVVKSELECGIKSLAFDSAVLLATLFGYLFRKYAFSGYISPVTCIIIAIFVIIRTVKRILINIDELTDKTLGEEVQLKIVKALNSHYKQYDGFVSVNSHKGGDTLYIDLVLKHKSDETYGEMCSLLEELSGELEREIGKCKISLIINEENMA